VALTETLGTFLADFGVAVSFSGSDVGMLGIPDAPGVLALSSDQLPGVQATDKTVLIRTSQKGGLVPGGTITVDGVSGTVRYLLAHEDGAFTLVWWH
jgi:hypothetical protein